MLESFQEDKHRRAAKARNIDSRKRDLTTSLSDSALGKENSAILTESRKLVSGWRDALDKALQNVPVEILGDSERSGVRGSRLRQVAPGWGLPFSLFFTLLGEIRRRSSKSVVPADLGQRVMLHYRGFFEAVKNVRSRFESEFSGSQIQVMEEDADTATLLKLSPSDIATEMQGAVEQEQERVPIVRRWLAHIPGIATLVLIFWSQIYGILDDETSIFGAIFEVLNPSFIVGTIAAVLGAYAITSFVIWLREIQKVDHRLTKAEQATREIVRKSGQQAVDQLDANVNALYDEFESLKKLVGSR